MTKTITRLYNTYDHATQTIVALRAADFPDAEISLIGPANAATGLASDAPGAAGADAEMGPAWAVPWVRGPGCSPASA